MEPEISTGWLVYLIIIMILVAIFEVIWLVFPFFLLRRLKAMHEDFRLLLLHLTTTTAAVPSPGDPAPQLPSPPATERFLPELVTCANCGAEHQLTIEQRSRERFACPNCDTLLAVDFEIVSKEQQDRGSFQIFLVAAAVIIIVTIIAIMKGMR